MTSMANPVYPAYWVLTASQTDTVTDVRPNYRLHFS